MKPVYLTDKEIGHHLYPFSQIRSVADIRIGILTIREKWEALLKQEVISLHADDQVPANDAILFAANIIPSIQFIESLGDGGASGANPDYDTVKILQYPWHIFQWNSWALKEDFQILTRNRFSAVIPESVVAIHSNNIFVEEGARLHHCMLNATEGPIYIGKNAEIMEGSYIRGPFALCEGAVVKMGTRIYGATTVGPYSVVGGEIKNSVIFGYSNKAHDGYLGDSVIGEWCNLGAGTSNSNLKNNASEVRVWHQPSQDYIRAGLKCGLLMGDYSRCAINTSFNTATVIGVCSNIVGEGMPPKHVPNFSWGNQSISRYDFEKAMTDIANWKKLKNQDVTDDEINQLRYIFDHT
jgi:UDP-N-acetylglucosamine diphosphorylase / glucose-1-phosphate thymidylyltransferase / UDP-N-acetylgalactosamine diphosphorylase / glucosamine-1-phosphate N-acetyltransferase / galactosamine-1-phosphate N-acetyltransferase